MKKDEKTSCYWFDHSLLADSSRMCLDSTKIVVHQHARLSYCSPILPLMQFFFYVFCLKSEEYWAGKWGEMGRGVVCDSRRTRDMLCEKKGLTLYKTRKF